MAYITVEDMLNEGLTLGSPYDKERITECIALAQSTIEKLTGRFFEKRSALTLKISGTGHDTLWLPTPPVSEDAITSITTYDATHTTGEVVTATEYDVVMDSIPDGRYNPKVVKYTGTWPTGKRNIEVLGDFGFVESDESTPFEIQSLCKMIVVWALPGATDASSKKDDRIIEEQVGNYRYKLAEANKAGYFNETKIDNLIAMFKVKRMFAV